MLIDFSEHRRRLQWSSAAAQSPSPAAPTEQIVLSEAELLAAVEALRRTIAESTVTDRCRGRLAHSTA